MYKNLNIRDKILLPFGIGLVIALSALYWVITQYVVGASSGQPTLIIALAVLFVVVMLGAWNTSRVLVKPIRKLLSYAKKMARGDMAFEIQVDSKNEVGQLLGAFREVQGSVTQILAEVTAFEKGFETGDLTKRVDAERFQGEFHELAAGLNAIMDAVSTLVEKVRDSSELVSANSKEISAGAQSLAQGASEQASSLEEVSATVDEMTDFMRRTSDKALNARQMIEAAEREAKAGGAGMDRLHTALNDINVSSGNIMHIIKTIEDIAFQTSILALNAAVEAARAGLAGKGFAVVASEVKNLAAKSAKAAQETNALLVDNMAKARDSLDLGEEMNASLKSIVKQIDTTADTISEIAADSKHQSDTAEQINSGLMQVSSVTQSNTSTAEQSASSSEELAAQASLLRELVAHYRFRAGEPTVSMLMLPQLRPTALTR